MKPFTGNIIEIAKANSNYRKEVATVTGSQVVVMSIPPNDDVGEEVHHDVDQTLLFVAGTGKTVLTARRVSLKWGRWPLFQEERVITLLIWEKEI